MGGQYYLYENLLDDTTGIFAGSTDSNLATLALLGGLGGGSHHGGYYPSPSGYSQGSVGRKRRGLSEQQCTPGDSNCPEARKRRQACPDGDKDCEARKRRQACPDGDKDCEARQRRAACPDGDKDCEARQRRAACPDGDKDCEARQ